MQTESKIGLFGFGALGGVLPTTAKLATALVSIPGTPTPELSYCLGLILFGVIGGIVALTNTTTEIRHAIFAGIAAPAIIAGVMSGTGSSRQRTELFGMSAYAQELRAAEKSNQALIVRPTISGGVPLGASVPVTAEIKSDDKTQTIEVGQIKDFSSTSGFVLPANTKNVFISGKKIDLTGAVTNVDIAVKTKPTFTGDLLWALGAQRNYAIEAVSPIAK